MREVGRKDLSELGDEAAGRRPLNVVGTVRTYTTRHHVTNALCLSHAHVHERVLYAGRPGSR